MTKTRKVDFFPTPDSDSKNYPFVKHSSSFNLVGSCDVSVTGTHHTAGIMKKLAKGESISVREEKEWVKVTSTKYLPEYEDRRNALIVLVGELRRLELGNLQPKTRLVRYENSDGSTRSFPISERIKNELDFYDYYKEQIEEELASDFPNFEHISAAYVEGIGRRVTYDLLYEENDATFSNAKVKTISVKYSEENETKEMLLRCLVSFDGDETIGSVSGLFWGADQKRKVVNYPLTSPDVKEWASDSSDSEEGSTWEVLNQKALYMGKDRMKDYDTLPRIKHFVPKNWDFSCTSMYTKLLMQDQRFLNEKHFSMIKSYLISHLKYILVEIHAHPEDRERHLNFIQDQTKQIQRCFQGSSALREYFGRYYLKLLKTVLYEVHDFLLNNKHYRHQNDDEADQLQWKAVCNLIFESFTNLLILQDPSRLLGASQQEYQDFVKKDLSHFIRLTKEGDANTLSEVIKFYRQQQMHFEGLKAEDRLYHLNRAKAGSSRISPTKKHKLPAGSTRGGGEATKKRRRFSV